MLLEEIEYAVEGQLAWLSLVRGLVAVDIVDCSDGMPTRLFQMDEWTLLKMRPDIIDIVAGLGATLYWGREWSLKCNW